MKCATQTWKVRLFIGSNASERKKIHYCGALILYIFHSIEFIDAVGQLIANYPSIMAKLLITKTNAVTGYSYEMYMFR